MRGLQAYMQIPRIVQFEPSETSHGSLTQTAKLLLGKKPRAVITGVPKPQAQVERELLSLSHLKVLSWLALHRRIPSRLPAPNSHYSQDTTQNICHRCQHAVYQAWGETDIETETGSKNKHRDRDRQQERNMSLDPPLHWLTLHSHYFLPQTSKSCTVHQFLHFYQATNGTTAREVVRVARGRGKSYVTWATMVQSKQNCRDQGKLHIAKKNLTAQSNPPFCQ